MMVLFTEYIQWCPFVLGPLVLILAALLFVKFRAAALNYIFTTHTRSSHEKALIICISCSQDTHPFFNYSLLYTSRCMHKPNRIPPPPLPSHPLAVLSKTQHLPQKKLPQPDQMQPTNAADKCAHRKMPTLAKSHSQFAANRPQQRVAMQNIGTAFGRWHDSNGFASRCGMPERRHAQSRKLRGSAGKTRESQNGATKGYGKSAMQK